MYTLKVRGRFWIDSGDQIFLGEGRAELLKAILDSGSISKAAKSMGMSYKKAWNLVESMNKLSDLPLVITQTGGQKGGGATVTEAGLKSIKLYEKVEKAHAEFLQKASDSL